MIGVLKSHLSPSPKNILAVRALNELGESGVTSCLFYDYLPPEFPVEVQTNMLQKAEAFNFGEIVIADDLIVCQQLVNLVYASKRYFYVYDLDWGRIDSLRLDHLKPMLMNDSVELIARSESHSKIISALFKKPKYIMSNWDSRVLKKIVKDG